MRPWRAADHSPPSSAAVMEEYSYTSTHPVGHTGPVTGKLYFLFIRISNLETPAPTEREMIISVKVKLLNVLSCMLLVLVDTSTEF